MIASESGARTPGDPGTAAGGQRLVADLGVVRLLPHLEWTVVERGRLRSAFARFCHTPFRTAQVTSRVCVTQGEVRSAATGSVPSASSEHTA